MSEGVHANPRKDDASQTAAIRPFEDISPEILEALRDGNHDAYKTVYMMYHEGIREFVLTMTRSEVETQDITQDIFITLWNKRESVDPGRSMRGFIYTIARNSAIGYFRNKKVHDKYFDSIEIPLTGEDGATHEQEFIARETEILVKLALSRMPKTRRTVFEMSRYEDMSNEQIARKLKMTPSDVSSHLYNAKKDLRELLTLFMLLFVLR